MSLLLVAIKDLLVTSDRSVRSGRSQRHNEARDFSQGEARDPDGPAMSAMAPEVRWWGEQVSSAWPYFARV